MHDQIYHIVNYCGNLVKEELVVLLYDDTTKDIVDIFKAVINEKTTRLETFKIEQAKSHGAEPPDHIVKKNDQCEFGDLFDSLFSRAY